MMFPYICEFEILIPHWCVFGMSSSSSYKRLKRNDPKHKRLRVSLSNAPPHVRSNHFGAVWSKDPSKYKRMVKENHFPSQQQA
jgi:hypothetical protein